MLSKGVLSARLFNPIYG
ncbi:protein YchT [Escherichia coli]|nr:hypothetical protein [Escherichia coli]MCW3262343.1 protein YchT [Escherichia coli]